MIKQFLLTLGVLCGCFATFLVAGPPIASPLPACIWRPSICYHYPSWVIYREEGSNTNWEHCRELCKGNKNCSYFLYNDTIAACFHYGTHDKESQPVHIGGSCVEGKPECDYCSFHKHKCDDENSDQIRKLDIKNEAQCQKVWELCKFKKI